MHDGLHHETPRVSWRRWRFLPLIFWPLIFLPASKPGGSIRTALFRAFHALAVRGLTGECKAFNEGRIAEAGLSFRPANSRHRV